MPAHAQRRHQLIDVEAVLIAYEGKDHEVANFDVVLLEQTSKRILGLPETLECLLAY